MNKRYLELLSDKFKNRKEVISEIINLSTILTLPKGTEFFFSDLHGEHKSFIHLLRSASGVIKTKIDLLYREDLSDIEKQKLAHLIYYPSLVLENQENDAEWYEETIYHLINIAKYVSTKYTRSKVKKKLPEEYEYVIIEMLNCHNDEYIKSYYHDIIQTIISIDNAKPFIRALCHFIRDICIDYIHIIGDIYDRGARPDLIIDELMKYKQVDIQWGNHDISWMGASSGNKALMANVIRIAISYNCFDLLEDGYGINLRALSDFANNTYKNDLCTSFIPHVLDENQYDVVNISLAAKMHKAITIIQMKLEGQLIERHPEYQMNQRQWLKQIDYDKYTVEYLGKKYLLKDHNFPTINIHDPLKLSEAEEKLMNSIQASFEHSQRLHEHIQYLYQYGNMYKVINGNLLFHGCIPLDEQGNFRKVKFHNKILYGKDLLDELEKTIKDAYFLHQNVDDMWYLWCSKDSPVFGKSKLSMFEKYFIDDRNTYLEEMDMYYKWIEEEKTCKMILKHFHLDENKGHIINGHVPVKIKNGECPIKAKGRLCVIDGGISKAYHKKTGNAGYTLIYDSQHLQLASHKPYHIHAVKGLLCLTPKVKVIESHQRIKNRDCDIGIILQSQIDDLQHLLKAYQSGIIKEKRK